MESAFSQLSRQISPEFTLGPVNLRWYGLIMASSMLLAYYISLKRAPKYNIEPKYLDSIFTWTITLGILGARLYHVVDEWNYYSQNLVEIFYIWQGGLGIYGGLIGGALGLYLASKRYQLEFFQLLNLVAPSVAMAQGLARWGNFFNQEAFGPPTNLPWKIYIQPQFRPVMYAGAEYFHPVFLYESLLNLISALALFWVAHKTNHRISTAGLYLIFYGLIRLFTEQYRFDTALTFGLKTAYIISLCSIFLGIWLVHRQHKHNLIKFQRPEPQP